MWDYMSRALAPESLIRVRSHSRLVGNFRRRQTPLHRGNRLSGPTGFHPKTTRSMPLKASVCDPLPSLEQILFVECGVGCDQHGQNMTKAVVRACRNAIEFNSMPCVQQIVPNGYDGLVVNVKVGCPRPDEVDFRHVADVFPYGKVYFQAVEGGLSSPSGIKIKSMGDTEDAMLIACVAITVGWGLKAESRIEV